MKTTTEILTAQNLKPRLAFVGIGWIGLNRMKTLVGEDICHPVGLVDPVPENIINAKNVVPDAIVYDSLDELIESKPDGIVIASPSAMHAKQSIRALENGIAVFCQKPLARTAGESRKVAEAAQQADRLLGIDLSYRFTDGMQKIYQLAQNGRLGKIFAVDLVFHNAYGPDKAWFYDPLLSGGGCLIDLGIHLVDLALWVLGYPETKQVAASLMANGSPLADPLKKTEDFVSAQFQTSGETTVRLTCSWNLPAGKDAEIRAAFYGTEAAACFSNVNGSFYDFETSFCRGTSAEIISAPPDDWGGKALVEWTKRLKTDKSFDPGINHYLQVAGTIDKIYGRQ